jgi:hypothetical protein
MTHLRAGILAVLLAGAVPTAAVDMSDPERQGAMFKRVFSYDKELRTGEKIVVIIVAESRASASSETVASAFREKGFFPAVVTTGELSDDLTATLTSRSAVLYVMPGVAYATVKDFAAAKGFLTISGARSLAEEGHVSVSVDVAAGKPEIIVNMPRLQTERHELSSELLNLARVIR